LVLRPKITFDGDHDAFGSCKNLELLSFWARKACPKNDRNQQLSPLFLIGDCFHRQLILAIIKVSWS